MRTVAIFSLTVGLTTALACGGTKKDADEIEQDPIEFEEPEAPAAGVPGEPGEAHLKVIEMTIKDPAAEILIKADGTIEVAGNKVGTITAKGEMLHANGALLAKLKPDGTIEGGHLKTEDFEGISVGEDGVLLKAGTPLMEITEDGTVTANGTGFFTLIGDVEGRRAAMFVIVIATMPHKKDAITKAPDPAPEKAPETEEAPK